MEKLLKKDELYFFFPCLILYILGCSFGDSLSRQLGTEKIITFPFCLLYSIVLFQFFRKQGMLPYYGLCLPKVPSKAMLYYTPLVLLASVNLWAGVRWNLPWVDTLLTIGSMLLVGFLEELLFRGLLFKAMCRKNLPRAVMVSSLTFGLGHIVNLFNGSGESLAAGLCQVCYAFAIGFVFVLVFLRSKSLWPCILTHGVLNSLSVFTNEEVMLRWQIPVSLGLIAVSLGYALYIIKYVPEE